MVLSLNRRGLSRLFCLLSVNQFFVLLRSLDVGLQLGVKVAHKIEGSGFSSDEFFVTGALG